jgi:two-component system chemotaxis sensor kinase CheA
MDELRDDFIAETRETLEILAAQLVQWEKTPTDRSLIDSAFRFVHTVKGSCGFLDLPRLLRLSHAAEEVLSFARDGRIEVGTHVVSATLAVIDRIAALTDALETGNPVFDDDARLIDVMLQFLPTNGTGLPVSEQPTGDLDAAADDLRDDMSSQSKARTVRVSLNLLDNLMNGVSDLVLARNEVSRQLRKLGGSSDVDNAFGRLSSTVAEMRDAIGLMRMQHIDRLFSSLPRLLRDICVELNKQIDLTIEGSEVEVDREMVEALRDPLTHILRNSADHGIESADVRRAMGKDPVGKIHVVARQSGNQIVIEIADDGCGIDIEKLGRRAIDRKMVTQAQWQKKNDREKLDMIFAPGFSTADAVTAISGRGVGMDVVRANMHAIGGTIDLENEEGRGLKITLRLPLTLSIIAGLSLRAGGQVYGISRSAVAEIVSLANRNVSLESIGGVVIAKVRGERLAYAKLEDILQIDAVEGETSGARTLVIIRPAVGATFALDVEAVVDNEELVVKPGAPLIMSTGLYAGTTLPDNGRPMLLLDTSGLAATIGVDREIFRKSDNDLTDVGIQTDTRAASALLFTTLDKSLRAIRLSCVDRMEDIDCAAIHEIGKKLCVSLNDRLYDLFGIEERRENGSIKVLRLSDGDNTVFLAIEDVLDIFALQSDLAPSAQPELFEGIVHVNGKPIEMLNVFSFFERGLAIDHGQSKPLCFIAGEKDDSWESRMLAPLLTAAGYDVSFDEGKRDAASVILVRESSSAPDKDDSRVLRLRDSMNGGAESGPSIYRYDRIGLLSAIGARIGGTR